MFTHADIQKYFPLLLTEEEMTVIEEYAKALQPDDWEHKWEPDCGLTLVWAADVVHMARKRNLITSDVLEELLLRVSSRT